MSDHDDAMPPYARSSATSKAAALSKVGQTRAEEDVILAMLVQASDVGRTCDEIEAITHKLHQSVSARLNSLWHKGVIIRSGRKRRTRTGREADVWIVRPPKAAPVARTDPVVKPLPSQGELF